MKAIFLATYVLSIFLFDTSSCTKPNAAKGVSTSTTSALPSHPLNSEKELDRLLAEIGDAKIVMLGEASHGTSEYYTWRAAISKRLIQEKGFNIIAVEGEWADSYRVNQYIKGPAKDSLQTVALLQQYDRWPTWMWGNYEVASLVTWLNNYNQNKAATAKVGFYGLDVYCLWESSQELMPYIQGNTSLINTALQVQQCFKPYSADPMNYAYAVYNSSANCRSKTENLWKEILNYTGGQTATNETHFVMQQNALVALNGERYYRTSTSSYPESWNIRDQHMRQTINRLLQLYGATGKMIVWAHNTHVGDARYTDMASEGMVNIGQLARQDHGSKSVYIVGFGSYKGNVIASNEWGGPVQTMTVPPAQKGSWEELLHKQGAENKILFSNELRQHQSLKKSIGHRAIGVQYNPNREMGNYVPTNIPLRYDAFIFIDQTKALRPLGIKAKNEPPDTYPSGY